MPPTAQENLPQHVAIIMDGNGRWARTRGVSRVRGHSQGGEAFRSLLQGCAERPYLKYLTLYAFSLENWQRSTDEVSDLMNLLRHYVKREAQSMHENNIRIRFIGAVEHLPRDIMLDLQAVEAMTAGNAALTVTMAISYGARQELAAAAAAIAAKAARGELDPATVDDQALRAHLYTHDLPDPDLLIRTGGDLRISNFLLWQMAYTELYFTDILWPDFTVADLDAAVADYQTRERRFGTRKESAA